MGGLLFPHYARPHTKFLTGPVSVERTGPFAYLSDVLERIVSGQTKANQLETLLPWNWQPASKPAAFAKAA